MLTFLYKSRARDILTVQKIETNETEDVFFRLSCDSP